jgi:IS30 family transposase
MLKQIRLSAEETRQIWDRRRGGQTVTEIAEALGRSHTAVGAVVRQFGGYAPRLRTRASRVLQLTEREEISRGVGAGMTMRAMAAALGRAASTISREIARNLGPAAYRACRADAQAWDRARRPKPCKLASHPELCRVVSRKLQHQQWSPQQICGWLEQQYPHDHSMRVSHETLYKTLFVQARGVLKKELCEALRSQRSVRRMRSRSVRGRGHLLGTVSIRERPAQAEDRAVPGHWEGDLLCGSHHSQIATLVERSTRYLMLVKLPTKHSPTVVSALSRRVLSLPVQLRRSLTWDRGAEMGEHKQFTLDTDVPVYFCDPHSPWQRGSNENINGLLRQYFPKGTDLSVHSQPHLDAIARKLNTRPRQTLNFQTPAYRLNALLVASTG